MIHEMKLQSEYFNFILNGTKRIEIRLFDEKRKNVQVGDKIKFFNIDNLEESFITKVVGLSIYSSFTDLINDYDISILADKSITKDDLIKSLENIYSKEKVKKYGVVGIMIELI